MVALRGGSCTEFATYPVMKSRKKSVQVFTGFSLIELMIVTAILAILMTLATPTFRNFSLRSHRTVAITQLLRLAACQEGIRAKAGLYNTATCLPDGDQYYRYDYSAPGLSATSLYTAMAIPNQAQKKDVCGAMMLDQDGHKKIENNNADVGKCWSSR